MRYIAKCDYLSTKIIYKGTNMAIKKHITSKKSAPMYESENDRLYREERNYRADRLVEKWSRVPEIGRGIKDLPTNTARNLAILLENQTRQLSRMSEAVTSANFGGQTPENLLRMVRLTYPNSIRGELFTEMALETMRDSIKYIVPVYTKAQRNDFKWDLEQGEYNMDDRFDDITNNEDVMYESFESRYPTELVNVADANVTSGTMTLANGGSSACLDVTFDGGALEHYIPQNSSLSLVVNGVKHTMAIQDNAGAWFAGNKVAVTDTLVLSVGEVSQEGKKAHFQIIGEENGAKGVFTVISEGGKYYYKVGEGAQKEIAKKSGTPTVFIIADKEVRFLAVGRFDSERDLTGMHLGEVDVRMKTYMFKPRRISMGITWTDMTEINLDTSFGISAEEVLLDSVSQEIKKALDFQAIEFASYSQQVRSGNDTVVFNAEGVKEGAIKDSYWHTAQTFNQAIGHVSDEMLNKYNRGGVSAIVGGPKAIRYLELLESWDAKGAQPAIGGHKVGNLGNLPVYKVPAGVIADDEILTTWKNPTAEADVSLVIGTLVPFYSTGKLPRKNFYFEEGIARYEDTRALQPKYLGRIKITNIR